MVRSGRNVNQILFQRFYPYYQSSSKKCPTNLKSSSVSDFIRYNYSLISDLWSRSCVLNLYLIWDQYIFNFYSSWARHTSFDSGNWADPWVHLRNIIISERNPIERADVDDPPGLNWDSQVGRLRSHRSLLSCRTALIAAHFYNIYPHEEQQQQHWRLFSVLIRSKRGNKSRPIQFIYISFHSCCMTCRQRSQYQRKRKTNLFRVYVCR